jgi:hypothetical protein
MASIIRIKRSPTSGNPTTLGAGELAYSALAGTQSNGGDRLYIGFGTETSGDAANHYVIGGKYFTDMLDHTIGTLTASSAILVDASSKIDNLKVDNLDLNGNTLSTTDTNGNLLLTPNGTGKTVVTNLHIGDVNTSIAEYIYDTVGGAITGTATRISVTNSDVGNTSTIDLITTAVDAGSYGSATAIPTFTVDAYGRLTAAGSATISTSLSVAADSGTTDTVALGTDTLRFTGGTGLDSVVSNNTITFNIDSTVTTLTGTQTLTNKTLTSPTISAITGALGNFVITAAAGNNSISLTPTGTGTVDVNGARISGLGAPTQDTDAATKLYVDTVAEGLTVKPAVRVATTANITATYNNGTNGVGATLTIAATATLTIDGVNSWTVGDGILVKNQTSAFQNGRYYVSTVGNISTAWVLTRCPKCDEPTEIPSMYVFVQEGTTYASTGWVATVEDFADFDVGVDDITFTQFSGAGTYLAGNGLTITGSTFNVVGTANRILVNADSVDIASTYVGQTSITTLGTIGTGTWQSTLIAGQYGGTGVNNSGKTITIGGNFTHTGAHTLGLTTTNNTSVTLPTSGTLATLAGTEGLSNKTITLSSFSGTTVAASSNVTFTSTTDATALGTAPVVLSGGLSVAKKLYVGDDIIGAGPGTSTIDGFQIDCGTY